jgi:hypothetical protein
VLATISHRVKESHDRTALGGDRRVDASGRSRGHLDLILDPSAEVWTGRVADGDRRGDPRE